MFIHPNPNPKKNKTFVNGKLLATDTPLHNGDRVLFGNHNLYIVNLPGQTLPRGSMDYEAAMQEVLNDQVNSMTSAADKSDMKDKYA